MAHQCDFKLFRDLRLNAHLFADLAHASLKRITSLSICLALLLNMLALSLSQTTQMPDTQLMLWGGFCSAGTSKVLPADFKKLIDPFNPATSNKLMQHGDCCCQHVGLTALPSNFYRHFLPRYIPDQLFENPELPTLHPRVRWPSLSPRASPFA